MHLVVIKVGESLIAVVDCLDWTLQTSEVVAAVPHPVGV